MAREGAEIPGRLPSAKGRIRADLRFYRADSA